MVLLASYPRSGNTFLRNVLFEVYGIESKTYHLESHGADPGWEEAAFVKTHELPENLPKSLSKRKTVYLIRDGRDSIVSLAHHRKNVFDIDSDIEQNLLEAINADEGSYFGGWSSHVIKWISQADIVIHFEDLIENPIAECERLREIIELPQPKLDRLPSFESLKNGKPEYGSGKYFSDTSLAKHWFRRGKVNAWKDELPDWLADRFWHLHGECTEFAGYGLDGTSRQSFVKDKSSEIPMKTVIFEASKITDVFTDGIKRYVVETLRAAKDFPIKGLELKVLINGSLFPLDQALKLDGQQDIKTGFAFQLAKNLAIAALPKSAYHNLAKSSMALRVKSGFKSINRSSKDRLKADVVHLTLPQHFESVSKIESEYWVATIHDLTHVKTAGAHTSRNVELAEKGMAFLGEMKARLIAVSEHTKKDLKDIELKSELVYEGVNRKQFFPVINQHWIDLIHDRYEIPKKQFLLSLCTLEPRKNLGKLIAAYAELSHLQRENHPLVLAGRKGWKWNQNLVPDHIKKQVHFIGFVEEQHLASLYSAAYAFCYVSKYEGFGLPALESMACGCPVIASNNTSLAEVVEQSGILVDPNSVDSIRAGIAKMLENETRDELGKKALYRSWQFTWKKSWEKTAALYFV
ncbi:glycosyltransferase [Salibacteraceae bacterium]|nr:glycosyltransferase [Salibacteraceae bacterium]